MAQMEVSYSRRLDYQYMMIDAGEDAVSDYRLSMLVHNRIVGFLPVYVQQMNGKSILSYEITSFEALPSFLEARKITYDEMVSLLLQFCSAVQEAGRYLLDGEGILLEPEYIYVLKSLECVRFCYYPYQHTPLYQSVNVLCRFLIDHIDYDDRRSLELAYGLFQESLKENLSISVIVGCIKNRLDAKNEFPQNTDPPVQEAEYISEKPFEREEKNDFLEKTDESVCSKQEDQAKNDLKKDSSYNEGRLQKGASSQRKNPVQKLASVFMALVIAAVLGYVLFTAGKRLLQVGIVSFDTLIVSGCIVAAASVSAAIAAYQILKPKS